MNTVEAILGELNPWWSKEDWYKKDMDIKIVESSQIERRIRYRLRSKWLKPLLYSNNAWGIRVIRGPRRIGKTTLMKLLIKDAIDLGIPPKSIVYITLDNIDIRKAINRDDISLRKLLKNIITKNKEKYRNTLIIIDEATFYQDWALAIKNLVDEHVIGPGVLLLVTGSYSLELSQAKRELEGRMGVLDGDDLGQRFLFPMRFVEFIENVSKEVNDYLKKTYYYEQLRNLSSVGTRLTILEELASKGNERVIKFFEETYSEIGEIVKGYLEEVYFYTGGFPKAIYSYLETNEVPDENYRSFYELLIQDAEKFNLNPQILKELIKEKLVNQAAFETTPSNLQIETRLTKGGVKKLGLDEVEKYMKYLTEGSRILFNLYPINPTTNKAKPITQNKGKPPKLIYADPHIFQSLYWISRGVKTGIHKTAKQTIKELMTTGSSRNQYFTTLYEATVCSHIVRIPILKYGAYTENYGRGLNENEYADCIAWYYDKMTRKHRLIPVEVTTSNKLNKEKIIEKAKETQHYHNTRLIVATRDQTGIIQQNNIEAAVIPAPLLLLIT